MFNLFENAKKLSSLFDYVATTPDAIASNPVEQTDLDEAQTAEVSINPTAIADRVLHYAKIASTVAQQKANKISDLVSQTTFDHLSKQQKQFEESLDTNNVDDFPLPWEGLPNEADVKSKFLELSLNSKVFLEDAPVEVDTEYKLLAKKMLEHDDNLAKLRYELVPKKLSEQKFWQNYMYRVSLLSKLIKEEIANETTKVADQPEALASLATDDDGKAEAQENTPETKVTKSLPEKSSPSEDDDWEKELLSAEYDVVKDEPNDESWENELDNLLESCKTEK